MVGKQLTSGEHLLKWNGWYITNQTIFPGIYHSNIAIDKIYHPRKIVFAS